MKEILLGIAGLFWLLLFYYLLLTIAGVLYRSRPSLPSLKAYPSVAVLIPAYNEGKVLSGTLTAMTQLQYPGKLRILVLNDQSTDETGDVADQFAALFPFIEHVLVPTGLLKGKARVLNYGLSLVSADYIAVYDADNQPEPDALRLLIEAAEQTPGAIGAVGYVKTINRYKNVLTEMIALEFSVFQLLMQCGGWSLFHLGMLPGTNMVVSRHALLDAGGWDEYALAEDAELTLRLTVGGGKIPIVPASRTWEQEPETFRVWWKQRSRWMQGNVYLILKALKTRSLWSGRTFLPIIQMLSVYLFFACFLLLSDTWFVLGLWKHMGPVLYVPLLLLWFQAWLFYVIQLLTAMTVDRMINGRSVFIAGMMYFTYAQLWIVLLLKGWIRQWRLRKAADLPVWDKTIRF
jgi:cellulose synthase/poly-beta-1,6-N-acetylglucosamine synthase-like glycosyltransferase